MSETPLTPPKSEGRALRWLWTGFFISLVLNLIVLGGAIGAAWHFHTNKAFRDGGAPRHFGAFLRRLPSERRDEFRDMLERQRPAFRPLRDKVRLARRKAETIIAKEPFDRGVFAVANRELHQARAKLSARRSEIFVQIVEAMTVEERRLFLEWRRKHRRHGCRWREKDQ